MGWVGLSGRGVLCVAAALGGWAGLAGLGVRWVGLGLGRG